jgi:hypothetical protein
MILFFYFILINIFLHGFQLKRFEKITFLYSTKWQNKEKLEEDNKIKSHHARVNNKEKGNET